MAKNRYRVTDEKIDLVLRLKRMCNSQRVIAQAVNLSQGTVNKILAAKYLDIEKTRKKRKSTHFQWEDYNNSII
jgi:hypothetical protein